MNNQDIKILEEKINKDYKDVLAVINSTSLPLFVEDTVEDMHILIEHLIERNKELEEINKTSPEKIKIIADSFHEKMAKKFDEEFIPKSKIKEKIEEYENSYMIIDITDDDMKEYYKLVIIVLQELLEE